MNNFPSVKTLDSYIIIRTLGTGYTGKVKLGRHKETRQLVALKIFDHSRVKVKDRDEILKGLKNELLILEGLDHPNIIKLYALVEKATYKNGKKEKTVSYAALEFAQKGEIFEVLSRTGPFSPNTARAYFDQLLSALEYLHSQKIAHRDLKPENLLLNDKLILKLVDFGFATKLQDGKQNLTHLGTERYMAPELLAQKPYFAIKSDVFAAGVVLFIFVTGRPPFLKADKTDAMYRNFELNRQNFWAIHQKLSGKEIDPDFKDLVKGMLEPDPEKRFGFAELRASNWMSQPIDKAKALDDMTKAHQKTQQMVDLEREEQKQESQMIMDVRSNSLSHSYFEHLQIKNESDCPTSCFLVKTMNIYESLDAIKKELEAKHNVKFTKNGDKVFVNLVSMNTAINAKMNVSRENSDVFAIRLCKQEGDYMDLMKLKQAFETVIRGLV